jgi:hypothetical protein
MSLLLVTTLWPTSQKQIEEEVAYAVREGEGWGVLGIYKPFEADRAGSFRSRENDWACGYTEARPGHPTRGGRA